MIRRLLVLVLALLPSVALAQTGTVMPTPVQQWFDSNGDPCNACKLYTYESGTTTPLATYTTSALSVANANPVVADSAGRMTVFLLAQAYKFVLKTSADVTIWTVDNVSATPTATVSLDVAGVAGESWSAGVVVYLSDGSGGRTAGRWYKAKADQTYSSSAAASIGFGTEAATTGVVTTIRLAGEVTPISSTTAGATHYISDSTAGNLTATPPASNPRQVGQGGTTSTALMIAPSVYSVPASSTTPGTVTIAAQSFAGAKTFASAAVFSAGASFAVQPTTTAGTGSGSATIGGTLNVNTTVTGNVGVGEDTLATYTVPANTLSANGKLLRITVWGQFAANANNKEVRVRFGGVGGTAVADTGVSGFNNLAWNATAIIVRTGAATQTSTGNAYISNSAFTTSRTAPTQTLSGTVDIVVTGEATANDDVQIYGLIVEVVN